MPDTGKLESWIAMNADARARGQPTMPYPTIGPDWLAQVLLVLSTIAVVGLALWYAFKFITTSWQQLPALSRSPLAYVCGAMGVVAVGGLMCLLKRRRLLVYGSTELGVAIATGMMAIYQLRRNDDRWTFLLAVIGAMYVFARGSDNVLTAIINRQKSRQSEASSVSA
jgi:hypothetical protein